MVAIDIKYEGNLRTTCIHRPSGEELTTDAPVDNQGKGEYFSPTDLLAASLGSCVLTLMGIAAKQLGIDISGTRLSVEKEMKAAPARMLGRLTLNIYCPSSFDPKITGQLEKAGRGCPVHHSLHPDVLQEFHFHWGMS